MVEFKLYRFSPILSRDELLTAIAYLHQECHRLCKRTFGEYLPNAGNLGVFCHYDEEYRALIEIRNGLTAPSSDPAQKYHELLEPLVMPADGDIPETTYTHLYIRRPDPYRHHVGDIDFYLEPETYQALRTSLETGDTLPGARIFPRNDLDMIELHDPDSDALAYVSTHQMTMRARIKQSSETNL